MILTWNLDQYLKLTRKTKQRPKKIDNDVMSANCDVIVIFPIYDQFGAIWKPDSGCTVCKFYIFIYRVLSSFKNWKQNKNISNTALTTSLWVKVLLLPKNADFLQKDDAISKIKRVLVLKGIFSETAYVRILTHQISSFWHNSNEF